MLKEFDRSSENFRFLKSERIIPFGVGKRSCMGEILARNEILLFTVNFLQKLNFFLPNKNTKPSLSNYYSNLTRIPKDFYFSCNAVQK